MKTSILLCLDVSIAVTVMFCSDVHAVKALNDEEALAVITEECVEAFRTQDVGALMIHCSDDFKHPAIGNKDGLKKFLESVKLLGVLDDAQLDIESAQTTIAGDSATVGPVAINTFHGTATLGYKLTKEDGKWLLTGLDFDPEWMVSAVVAFGGVSAAIGQTKPMDINESTEASVVIDSDAEAKPYSPMLFGGFLEHFNRQVYGGVFEPGSPLSDENGFRTDVVEALRELKVPVVRWPGGCFVSGYHWKDGVGLDRQPTDDMAWGVKEPNTFGTDEFVELCRIAGWEPFICNNAGNGTVQEMVDWVAYCNQTDGAFAEMRKKGGHTEPLNVNIWSIGNENWGGHEIGQKTREEWGPLVVEAAKAMKAVDPDIQLSAAALPNRDWTLPLLKMAGDYLDYISIHQYWLSLWGDNKMPDYLTCIMESEGPEKLLADYIGILEEAGYRGRIKIAFDEWNLRGWHHPGFPRKAVSDYDDPEVIELVKARDKNLIASQYTMADALFTASFLNACLRHAEDVGMANIAPIVNTRGPLYVHPKGIVKRTHFHTLAMYANLLGRRVGKAVIEDTGSLVLGNRFVAMVDAIATVDDTGDNWSIALVNRHPSKVVDCTVKLKDTLVDGTFSATILAGDSPEAYNDIENPERVIPEERSLAFDNGIVNLPPHSLTIVQVPVK